MRKSQERFQKLAQQGFTLIEMLTVIGTIGVLTGMVVPIAGRARSKASAIQCLNNCRQLNCAWNMYASDNDERLAYNIGGVRGEPVLFTRQARDRNWVNNLMDWETNPANTNRAFAEETPLHLYTANAAAIFRCPADRVLSAVQRKAGWSERVRSISMNGMVGNPGESLKAGINLNNPEYRQFLKLSEVVNPSSIFVFLDEHPDSINDGYFLNKPDDFEWMDLPASFHDNGASVTFADGHVQTRHWICASTHRPNFPDAAQLPIDVPARERTDFNWLAQVTSVER